MGHRLGGKRLYPQSHTASPDFVLRQSLAGWLGVHHAVWSDLKLKAVSSSASSPGGLRF